MAVEVAIADHRRLINDAWQTNSPIQMFGVAEQLPDLSRGQRQHLFGAVSPGLATHATPLHIEPQGRQRRIDRNLYTWLATEVNLHYNNSPGIASCCLTVYDIAL